jgi:hypothetical protein
MNPSTPQFNEGVKPIPGGSQPTTPSSARVPYPDYYKVMTPPLPINSARGGTETSKYAQGERMAGKGEASERMKPVPRPEPGQGAKVIGTHSMKIGGPKGALGGGGLRGGPLGGGGAFGKIK